MKAVLTLVAIIFFNFTAVAQNGKEVKVETSEATVVLNITIEKDSNLNKEVARLYRYKNSRVKKALSFRTKRNRAKLA
jgi:hypothetical protein